MSAIGNTSRMLYYRFLCVLQIRVHARSFDRYTCLLYFATKFLSGNHFIPFDRTNFTNACRLAASLELVRNK